MKFGTVVKKVKKSVGKMGRGFKASKIAKAARSPAHLTPPKRRRGLY
jgi:hypothetical protein